MQPLRLLGGLINVPEFNYRFVLNIAKIEIMASDIPRIKYDTKDKVEKNPNADTKAVSKNEESVRKMQERIMRMEQENKKTFTEFLNESE